MLLVITRSHDPTTDYVLERVVARGYPHARLNTDQLLRQSYSFALESTGWTMCVGETHINLAEVTSVWYRRPVVPLIDDVIEGEQMRKAVTDEADALQKNIYALLSHARWVSHHLSIRVADDKLMQLVHAQRLGFAVPDTLVTSSTGEAHSFYYKHNGHIVMKTFRPVKLDTEEPEKVLGSYTTRVTPELLPQLENVDLCPTILQCEVERDYELRVTVFGDDVFAARIDTVGKGGQLDWRQPDIISTKWEKATIPDELRYRCLAMVKVFNLNYAAFDIGVTPSGEYVFFEVNPNGQWVWLEIDTEQPMTEALLRTLNCM